MEYPLTGACFLSTLLPIPAQSGLVWLGSSSQHSNSYTGEECLIHVSHFLPGVPCDTRGGGIRWGRKIEVGRLSAYLLATTSSFARQTFCTNPRPSSDFPTTVIIGSCSELSFYFKFCLNITSWFCLIWILWLKPNTNSFKRKHVLEGSCTESFCTGSALFVSIVWHQCTLQTHSCFPDHYFWRSLSR